MIERNIYVRHRPARQYQDQAHTHAHTHTHTAQQLALTGSPCLPLPRLPPEPILLLLPLLFLRPSRSAARSSKESWLNGRMRHVPSNMRMKPVCAIWKRICTPVQREREGGTEGLSAAALLAAGTPFLAEEIFRALHSSTFEHFQALHSSTFEHFRALNLHKAGQPMKKDTWVCGRVGGRGRPPHVSSPSVGRSVVRGRRPHRLLLGVLPHQEVGVKGDGEPQELGLAAVADLELPDAVSLFHDRTAQARLSVAGQGGTGGQVRV